MAMRINMIWVKHLIRDADEGNADEGDADEGDADEYDMGEA